MLSSDKKQQRGDATGSQLQKLLLKKEEHVHSFKDRYGNNSCNPPVVQLYNSMAAQLLHNSCAKDVQ